MAKDNGSRSELSNYKLVGQMINNNYQLRVTTAKAYAALEEKLATQAGYKNAQHRTSVLQKTHKQNLQNIEAAHRAEIARIQSLGLSKQRLTTELAKAEVTKVQQVEAERRRMQAERLAFEQQIAAEAESLANAQYAHANVLKQREIQFARSAHAQLHIESLKDQDAECANRIAALQAEANKFAANSRIRKQYEAEITRIQQEQLDISNQISAVKSEEIAAYNEQRRLTNVIRDAQIVAAKQAGVNAEQLLTATQQAADTARQSLQEKMLEIETSIALNVDPEEIQKLQEEASRLSDTVNDLAAMEAQAAAAAKSPNASGKYKEDSKREYQRKHDKAEIDKAKASVVDPTDMAREMKDERELDKINTTKQAQANWESFLDPSMIGDKVGKAVANAIDNMAAQISQSLNQIDDNINNFYKYQSSVEARLQGSDESYKKSLKNISKNVGISGLVSQKDVIENLKKLSEAGIAYNLDLRAFLATIKDDIAETFDVFDSNLMRLIRLQQSDTTAARLGMEASLTRLFNEFFSDTSYLTDAADTVSQAIIDANSQLTKNMSIEFEYMVQKWLGSLYSLGMDSGTISTIAQGLNYLGTGNVEALNGNESLQSLLAMSASRAGISYADILTGGLDADTTNNLMKSMIEYLKSIAENTDNNQVTKSAYSNVFGFSISDLTAVSSLSETDIANIHKQSIDYEGAMDEYEYQASQIFNRTHFSQMLNTVFDNAMMSASTAIGNNAGVYATWKVLNVVEDLTGGIAIPGISVMGNMVDLHQTVTGLAKTGIAGLGLMGSLLGSLFNGSLFGTMDAKTWGYDEFTSRGSATKGISKGTAQGTSESTSMNMVGSSSSSDIKSTSMNDATDEAEEDSKVTNKNVEENADIYTKIYEAIANEDTTVLQEVINLQNIINDQSLAILDAIGTTNELLRESRRFKAEMSGMDTMLQMLDPSRVFYTAIVSMLPITANQFAMSENKVLTLTNRAIQTAIQATSASVQKNTTEAIEEITSVATDIKEGNYTQLNAAPVIEPNMVVNVTTPVPQVTIDQEDKESNPPDITVAAPDITQFGKDTSTAITKLESAISSVDTQNIANLMAQTSVGMHDSNDKTTNQLITNDGLKVSINQMSPEVSAYIAATVKSMVASAITGGITDVDKEGEGVPLIQLLTNLLQSSTLNVNVTNDNFDTALQKSAFTT